MSERIYHGYPFDWIEMPLNEVCSIVDYRGKTPTKVDEGILLVTAKNIMLGSIDYEISREYIKEDDFEEVMRRGYAEIGDVLYTTEAPLGNVAQVDRCKIALAQRVVKFSGNDSLDNTYLKYFMMSEDFRNHIDKQATGSTVKGIKGSRLKVSPVAIPPLPEQKKIAKILSTVDGHIDEVDGMIEDLKELKKGLMQKLLTEGIGHTEFKDSEVGRIPKEWEVKALGELFPDLKAGSTPSRKVKEYYKGNIPWITSGELNYNVIIKTIESITEKAVKDTNLKVYPVGTFFIAITGLEAAGTRGSCAISGVEATTNQSCMAFVPKKNFSNMYLFYWYQLYGERLAFRHAQGTKQQSFNNKIVADFKIAVPPFSEQEKISTHISSIEEMLNLRLEELEELKILKKGLMQQLLTGQVRVMI